MESTDILSTPVSTSITMDIAKEKAWWEHMTTIARTLIASKALPAYIQSPEQAMVTMQAGQEMGFRFMESVKYLYIINGLISITGQGTIRRLTEYGYTISYKEEEDKCTASISRGKELIAEETVTFQEAEKSGYTTSSKKDANGNTVKDQNGNAVKVLKAGWLPGINRKLKLRYLAISVIVKTYVPYVLGGAVDIAEVVEDYPMPEKYEDVESKPVVKDVDKFIQDKKKEKIKVDVVVKPKTEKEKEQEVEAILDVKPGEAVEGEPVDPKLAMKRKEFFATAQELGLDGEVAKEEVKKYYGEKDSFNNIGYFQLAAYVKAMKTRISQKEKTN